MRENRTPGVETKKGNRTRIEPKVNITGKNGSKNEELNKKFWDGKNKKGKGKGNAQMGIGIDEKRTHAEAFSSIVSCRLGKGG